MKKISKHSKLLPIAVIILIYAVVVSVSGIINVNAASDIFTIKNVEAVEKSNAIEIKSLSFEKSTINSNVVFHNVGEYVKYKITIQNDEDKNYKIKAITDDNQNGCVTYEYLGWSDTEIKANNTADFYVTAKYSKEVEDVANKSQDMDVKVDIQLEDDSGNIVTETVTTNTKTGDKIGVYVSLLAISIIAFCGLVIVKRKGKNSKKLFSALLVIVLATPAVAEATEGLLVLNFKSTIALEDKIIITYVDDLTGKKKSSIAKYGESVAVVVAPDDEPDDFIAWVDDSGKVVSGNLVATSDLTLYAKRKSDEDYEKEGLVFTLGEDDTYTITEYTGEDSVVRIPAKYKGKAVTAIGNEAFKWCEITNIFLPNGLKTIGDHAFDGCDYLKSVDIPDSVTDVGEAAFLECTDLERVKLSKKLTSISPEMFVECTNLSSIEIPDSVTSIGMFAFFRSGLSSCTVGNGVVTIGQCVFRNCDNLKSIVIPDSVEQLGDATIWECPNLQSLSIGKGVSSIGAQVCTECPKLTSISIDIENPTFYVANNCILTKADNVLLCAGSNSTIPNNTTSIREYAFCGSSIVSLNIPNSVTTIGRGAFSECTDLTSVTIGKNVTSMGPYLFADCDKLESLTVDADNSVYYSDGNCIITKADKKVVEGCNNSILPNDITCIGEGAFSYRNLIKSVKIPISVTSIETEAFFRCVDLEEIIYPGTQEQWDNIPKGEIWLSQYYGTVVFVDSTDFTYTLLSDDTYEVTGYTGDKHLIIVPPEHNGKTVTSIGANALSTTWSVSIPRTITNIGENAITTESLARITYRGTEEEWNNIEKADNWLNDPSGLCKITYRDTITIS